MTASLKSLQQKLGVEVPLDLLELAVTHRSYAYEKGGLPTNERLEFLGDSVLGLVVTDTLYRKHPDVAEGQLAKLRSAVVNATALAEVGRALGLGDYVLLGKGELSTGGRDKASILADTTEAVIGATYLGVGLEAATELVHRFLDPVIEIAATLGAGLDWKTSLQELSSALGLGVPEYVIEESGPDHDKRFTARVKLGSELFGYGEGKSKKAAEQQAASSTYEEIQSRSQG
jgi:ribonuclease-3